MGEIEHYQENLNLNFTNELAIERFLEVCKIAQAELNHRYKESGAFHDPAFYDPQAPHPKTWENMFDD